IFSITPRLPGCIGFRGGQGRSSALGRLSMSLERCIRLIVSAALLVVLALEAPARSEAPRGKKYALLVGVTEYQRDTFTTLKYTENDVERLARLLNRPGSGFAQVRVLTVSRGKKNSKDA